MPKAHSASATRLRHAVFANACVTCFLTVSSDEEAAPDLRIG
ncbi:MAG TPA: hypothetical protein VJ816_09350 [Gemmatimonadales bacterium]|nr:hypothetical protein [Gemmatimonadales bacterium]